MIDLSKLSYKEYLILQYISNEIDSYRLKPYAGGREYLLTYVHTFLYEKYNLEQNEEGVQVRSKENPDSPIMIDNKEFTFQEAVKGLLGNLIDK